VPHLPEVKPADHKNIPMTRERCGKYGWFGSKAIEGWGCSRRMVRAKALLMITIEMAGESQQA
jgi:hypothetical protein